MKKKYIKPIIKSNNIEECDFVLASRDMEGEMNCDCWGCS